MLLEVNETEHFELLIYESSDLNFVFCRRDTSSNPNDEVNIGQDPYYSWAGIASWIPWTIYFC